MFFDLFCLQVNNSQRVPFVYIIFSHEDIFWEKYHAIIWKIILHENTDKFLGENGEQKRLSENC